MEITILSAEGLENKLSTILSGGVRPFAIITLPPCAARHGEKAPREYKTRVDKKGGINPIWGDKFNLPVDVASLCQTHFPYLYLQILTKNIIKGHTQLGWCHIPAVDIADGLSPPGTVRRLSYRLLGRDGSRGKGLVRIAIKLKGCSALPTMCPQWQISMNTKLPEMGFSQMVVAVPVTIWPPSPASGINMVRS